MKKFPFSQPQTAISGQRHKIDISKQLHIYHAMVKSILYCTRLQASRMLRLLGLEPSNLTFKHVRRENRWFSLCACASLAAFWAAIQRGVLQFAVQRANDNPVYNESSFWGTMCLQVIRVFQKGTSPNGVDRQDSREEMAFSPALPRTAYISLARRRGLFQLLVIVVSEWSMPPDRMCEGAGIPEALWTHPH